MTYIRKTWLPGSFACLALTALVYAAVQSGSVLAEDVPSRSPHSDQEIPVVIPPSLPPEPPTSSSSTSPPSSPPPFSPHNISIDLTTIVVGTMAIGFAFATTKRF